MLRAVATDGHRLAQVEVPLPERRRGHARRDRAAQDGRRGAASWSRTPRSSVDVELSDTKIRFAIGDVVLTSKLIDGTFPDYDRVIPQGNDKELMVDKSDFEAAVDRVSTISSRARPRGEAGARRRQAGAVGHQPGFRQRAPRNSTSTTPPTPLEIGFNSRYLLDIADQIEGEAAVFRLADPGSPTLIQDGDAKSALYVLMPMRV